MVGDYLGDGRLTLAQRARAGRGRQRRDVPERTRRPDHPPGLLDDRARARASAWGSRATSRRTSCATRARRTCSITAPTCGSSRSCSATRASRRRRCTRRSRPSGCERSTTPPTPGPGAVVERRLTAEPFSGGTISPCPKRRTTDPRRSAHRRARTAHHRARGAWVSIAGLVRRGVRRFGPGHGRAGRGRRARRLADARRSPTSTTRSRRSSTGTYGRLRAVRTADRRGSARSHARGAALHRRARRRVADRTRNHPMDRVTIVFFVALVAAIILHEICARRGRAVVRRRHRQAGRSSDAQPDPAHRPVRIDHHARVGCDREHSRDRLGKAGAGEPEPPAQPADATCCSSRSRDRRRISR